MARGDLEREVSSHGREAGLGGRVGGPAGRRVLGGIVVVGEARAGPVARVGSSQSRSVTARPPTSTGRSPARSTARRIWRSRSSGSRAVSRRLSRSGDSRACGPSFARPSTEARPRPGASVRMRRARRPRRRPGSGSCPPPAARSRVPDEWRTRPVRRGCRPVRGPGAGGRGCRGRTAAAPAGPRDRAAAAATSAGPAPAGPRHRPVSGGTGPLMPPSCGSSRPPDGEVERLEQALAELAPSRASPCRDRPAP